MLPFIFLFKRYLHMSLENELLKQTNKDFCFLTSSGSAAIILALISSNIPTGSEILFLPYVALLFYLQFKSQDLNTN